MRRLWHKFRPRYLLIPVIAFLAFYIICAVVPFEPYHLYGYELNKLEFCPGEEIEVQADRELAEGYGVEELRVDAYWIDNTTTPPIANTARFPTSASGRQLVPNPVIRRVPNEPGEWILAATVTAHGWMYIAPRSQVQRVVDTPPITVLDPRSEQCQNVQRGAPQ